MFFKKKPLTFRFVTSNKSAFLYAKPDKGTKFFPNWWKDLAKGNRERESMDMTHCHGFLDLYKEGIVVPMWSYLKVTVGAKDTSTYFWEFADAISQISEHPEWQRGSFMPNKEYQHVKLLSPWLLECDEDVSVLLLDSFYRDQQDGAATMHGILKPKEMSATNLNLILPRGDQPKTYEFDLGHPIVQIIPLTERDFKIEHVLLSEAEFNDRVPAQLFSKYNRHTKALRALKDDKPKCPFGGK